MTRALHFIRANQCSSVANILELLPSEELGCDQRLNAFLVSMGRFAALSKPHLPLTTRNPEDV